MLEQTSRLSPWNRSPQLPDCRELRNKKAAEVLTTHLNRKSLACWRGFFFLEIDRYATVLSWPLVDPTGLAARDGLYERGRRQKIWKGRFSVCIYCNPLEFHEIAKEFFGNPWSKTAQIWKCLAKSLAVGSRARSALRRERRPTLTDATVR